MAVVRPNPLIGRTDVVVARRLVRQHSAHEGAPRRFWISTSKATQGAGGITRPTTTVALDSGRGLSPPVASRRGPRHGKPAGVAQPPRADHRLRARPSRRAGRPGRPQRGLASVSTTSPWSTALPRKKAGGGTTRRRGMEAISLLSCRVSTRQKRCQAPMLADPTVEGWRQASADARGNWLHRARASRRTSTVRRFASCARIVSTTPAKASTVLGRPTPRTSLAAASSTATTGSSLAIRLTPRGGVAQAAGCELVGWQLVQLKRALRGLAFCLAGLAAVGAW